jgi:hypothetical protein
VEPIQNTVRLKTTGRQRPLRVPEISKVDFQTFFFILQKCLHRTNDNTFLTKSKRQSMPNRPTDALPVRAAMEKVAETAFLERTVSFFIDAESPSPVFKALHPGLATERVFLNALIKGYTISFLAGGIHS